MTIAELQVPILQAIVGFALGVAMVLRAACRKKRHIVALAAVVVTLYSVVIVLTQDADILRRWILAAAVLYVVFSMFTTITYIRHLKENQR